jgi:hypothetical protein
LDPTSRSSPPQPSVTALSSTQSSTSQTSGTVANQVRRQVRDAKQSECPRQLVRHGAPALESRQAGRSTSLFREAVLDIRIGSLILVPMELVVRLIGEAWEHRRQRRRNAFIALWLVTIAVLGGVLVGRSDSGQPEATKGHVNGSGYVVESPSRLLSQAPYMGVHCPNPNSIACDRVGLAINLKQPARAVVAFIDGRKLKMNRRGDVIDLSTAPRKEFDGYLQPAGIESRMHVHPAPGSDFWAQDTRSPTPSAAVLLLIDYGGGRLVSTRVRVPLSSGWG